MIQEWNKHKTANIHVKSGMHNPNMHVDYLSGFSGLTISLIS